MPGTVDDFLQRFSSPQTMDDREASQYLDRFASDHPQDSEFDSQTMQSAATEYLGKLPEQDFHQAARQAYASAPPEQQRGLVGTLLGALHNRGVGAGALAGLFGGAVPTQMNADQYAQLANYTRQQHPEAMQEVVRQQPWIMKAMGNPILMGALGMVASRMVRNRASPPAQPRSGLFGR